jgi:hypothetical protein
MSEFRWRLLYPSAHMLAARRPYVALRLLQRRIANRRRYLGLCYTPGPRNPA